MAYNRRRMNGLRMQQALAAAMLYDMSDDSDVCDSNTNDRRIENFRDQVQDAVPSEEVANVVQARADYRDERAIVRNINEGRRALDRSEMVLNPEIIEAQSRLIQAETKTGVDLQREVARLAAEMREQKEREIEELRAQMEAQKDREVEARVNEIMRKKKAEKKKDREERKKRNAEKDKTAAIKKIRQYEKLLPGAKERSLKSAMKLIPEDPSSNDEDMEYEPRAPRDTRPIITEDDPTIGINSKNFGERIKRRLQARIMKKFSKRDEEMSLDELTAFNTDELRKWVIKEKRISLMTARTQAGKSNGINYAMYKALSIGKIPIFFMNSAKKLPLHDFYLKKVVPIAQGLNIDTNIILCDCDGADVGKKIDELVKVLKAADDDRKFTPRIMMLRLDSIQLGALKERLDATGMRKDLTRNCVAIADEAHAFNTMQPMITEWIDFAEGVDSRDDDTDNDLDGAKGGKVSERLFMKLLGRWKKGADKVLRLDEWYFFHVVFITATPEDLYFMQPFFSVAFDVFHEDRTKTAGYRGHDSFEKIFIEKDDFKTSGPMMGPYNKG
jgi:hypothetical protein